MTKTILFLLFMCFAFLNYGQFIKQLHLKENKASCARSITINQNHGVSYCVSQSQCSWSSGYSGSDFGPC